jgi:hypothetical protein
MPSESASAADVQAILQAISHLNPPPFWQRFDFVIATAIGLAGLYFSIKAFQEANKAKQEATRAKAAATEAGRTVKLQTVTLDLGEVSQKLDKLRPGIAFADARDLQTEISRRLRRAISPFETYPDLRDAIHRLRAALDAADSALKSVRPSAGSTEAAAPDAVYYALEREFSNIANLTADLMGLCENKTMRIGESDHDVA